MASLTDVKIKKFDGDPTITITVTKEFKARYAVAVALFKLGSWIAGFGFKKECVDEDAA